MDPVVEAPPTSTDALAENSAPAAAPASAPAIAERRGAVYHGMPVTRERYLDLPDDGYKYDMIDGVLFVAPSPEPEHGIQHVQFATRLQGHLDQHGGGYAMIEIDVLLPDGGDVLRPDLSFVRKENRGILLKHIHGAPDLVCEVLSDSTARRDLADKAERYLSNGVREYWIVDPRNSTLQLWIQRVDANGARSWEKRDSGNLKSELLPGFVLNAESFFRKSNS